MTEGEVYYYIVRDLNDGELIKNYCVFSGVHEVKPIALKH